MTNNPYRMGLIAAGIAVLLIAPLVMIWLMGGA